MNKILTNDGSYTIYSDKYKETYHSVTGAMEEAFEKYVKPCGVKDGMKILDVCFGLGYNSLAAMSAGKDLRIVGLENDPEILLEEVEVPKELEKNYLKIRKAVRELEYKDDDVSIKIIVGDALETISEVEEKFDVVFFDPFSPPKCPELWTAEFFSKIKSKMVKGGRLATYSCARKVRDALKEAGFEVKDGPCVGRRSPSTIAIA